MLRPLRGLPVIRDLVVDMTSFFRQYHSVRPYLVNETPAPERERLQTPAERDQLDGLYECILCACCSTACPSFWWNPDRFAGPAALLQAYRFIVDSVMTRPPLASTIRKIPTGCFRCRGPEFDRLRR